MQTHFFTTFWAIKVPWNLYFTAVSTQYKIIAVTETPLHRLLARMACRPELLVMLNFICSGRFERILKERPLESWSYVLLRAPILHVCAYHLVIVQPKAVFT